MVLILLGKMSYGATTEDIDTWRTMPRVSTYHHNVKFSKARRKKGKIYVEQLITHMH